MCRVFFINRNERVKKKKSIVVFFFFFFMCVNNHKEFCLQPYTPYTNWHDIESLFNDCGVLRAVSTGHQPYTGLTRLGRLQQKCVFV